MLNSCIRLRHNLKKQCSAMCNVSWMSGLWQCLANWVLTALQGKDKSDPQVTLIRLLSFVISVIALLLLLPFMVPLGHVVIVNENWFSIYLTG